MTQKRILELAYIGAMQMWDEADKNLRKEPNDLRFSTERRRWGELQEISRMLVAEE